jgi:predicted PurR-regulated permease PerM
MENESDQTGDQGQTDPEATDRPPLRDLRVIRGALVVMALGVIVAFLYVARVILIPIVLAIFLAYVLNPLVLGLQKLRVPGTQLHMPRTLATTVVVLMTVALTSALGVLLADQARQLAAELPQYAGRITSTVRDVRSRLLDFQDRVEEALDPIRRTTLDADGNPSNQSGDHSEASPTPNADVPQQPVPEAGVEAPPQLPDARQRPRGPPQSFIVDQAGDLWLSASSYLAGSLTGLVGVLVQAMTCVFVLFFTLVQAPAFRRKTLRIIGTTEPRREAMIEVFQDINHDVQGYLFGRFIINTCLAVVVSLVFFAFGLRYALLIGIFAGLLNFIPYVGAIIGMFIPALVAFMQFGDLSTVLWSAFIYLLLTGVEGNLITPIALGRHLRLNSLAVLLGLIFWGWLWGAIGMLLAIPILAVLRVVAEHVDDMKPVAELLRG